MFQPHNAFSSSNNSNPPFLDFGPAHRFGNHMDDHHHKADQDPSTSEMLYPSSFYGFTAFNISNPGTMDFGPYFHEINMNYAQEPDQATVVEEFERKIAFWRQKYKHNPLNLKEELVLDEYLFNPNGKVKVPQMVKKPVNSRSFYQNQQPLGHGYPQYYFLHEEENMKLYKIWDKVSQRQREQFEDGLIRFKTNNNFS
ncbi:hypothetical protein B9Z55_028242 [Caenorhabditis nigoni]|nr:hypothetical protein B9Z55_028242 [Caenorhabditis nigoni]